MQFDSVVGGDIVQNVHLGLSRNLVLGCGGKNDDKARVSVLFLYTSYSFAFVGSYLSYLLPSCHFQNCN